MSTRVRSYINSLNKKRVPADMFELKCTCNCLCFYFTVNKQINDKERVAAAMENPNLRDLVDKCINYENDYG